jgi:hypothetical protein
MFVVLNPTRKPQPPFMGASAICNFLRENEELQLEQELDRQSGSKIGTT